MGNNRLNLIEDNTTMSAKAFASLLYLALIVTALINPGTQIAHWIGWFFLALLAVHLGEFFLKRNVMQAAGGSMGNHFFQTMLFGFMHWKPLERKA